MTTIHRLAIVVNNNNYMLEDPHVDEDNESSQIDAINDEQLVVYLFDENNKRVGLVCCDQILADSLWIEFYDDNSGREGDIRTPERVELINKYDHGDIEWFMLDMTTNKFIRQPGKPMECSL